MATFEILEEYVESQRQDIEQGREVTVEIRDIDSFERLVVRAQIGVPAQPIDGGDRLVLKNLAENVVSDQWTIRVVEELDAETVSITPQSAYRKSARDGA
jgi:hypothetical protein